MLNCTFSGLGGIITSNQDEYYAEAQIVKYFNVKLNGNWITGDASFPNYEKMKSSTKDKRVFRFGVKAIEWKTE